jgi:Phage protein Gp138 N-terminal domain
MDRRERAASASTSLMAALDGFKSELWTALVGIVVSFDATKKTCVVQPAIRAQFQQPSGDWNEVSMPLLVDCPVVFPGGGGFTLTFPVQAGDECLVVFANRCIDAWWQSGGIQSQAEIRSMDLSDGICFVGLSSVPSVQPAISMSSVQLRSTSGDSKVSISSAGTIDVEAPGEVNLKSGNINIEGVLTINGEPYLDHRHLGVTAGPSLTQGVAP